jgi:membrane protein
MSILWKSLKDFFRHNGSMLAGAITCFTLMALVPFFLLLVSLFGYILGQNDAFYAFLSLRLKAFFPAATREITVELRKIIAYKQIGLFTLVVYGYFSYQLFYALESAVNTIFGTVGKRSFWVSIVLSMLVITALIIFSMLSFGVTSFISLIEPLARYFPALWHLNLITFLLGYILPILLVFIITAGLYLVLPHRKVHVQHALSGALLAAVLFEVAKHGFTYYTVMRLSRFGNVYGPLTVFVTFLLWVFFASCIFLLGSEVVHNLEEGHLIQETQPEKKGGRQKSKSVFHRS